jgi:hypothetical protein
MLAAPPCPHEADMVRELRPFDRVQEHVLGTDRIRLPIPACWIAVCPASCGYVAAVSAELVERLRLRSQQEGQHDNFRFSARICVVL